MLIFLGKIVVVSIACAFLGAISAVLVHDFQPWLVEKFAQLRQRWISK